MSSVPTASQTRGQTSVSFPPDPLEIVTTDRLAEIAAREAGGHGLGAVSVAEAARIKIEARWRQLLDSASQDDDEGSHVGIARHSRAVAQGMGEALVILETAIRSVPPWRDVTTEEEAEDEARAQAMEP